MFEGKFSGGCQCGAVRFTATKLGRPSICHCRMCQKHFGGFFGAFITAYDGDLHFPRHEPNWFRSSNVAERGFCHRCGTPLAYRHSGGIELAIGAFDHPELFEPQVQVNHLKRLPWIDTLFQKPPFTSTGMEHLHASVVSSQHPDHDTAAWPPREEQ